MRQQHGAVAFGGLVDVVGGDDHRAAGLGQGAQVPAVDAPGRAVQVGRGLVQQDQVGVPGEGLGQEHPLALAAGQGVQGRMGELLHPHDRHGLLHRPPVGGAEPAEQAVPGEPGHAHHVVHPQGQHEAGGVELAHVGDSGGPGQGLAAEHLDGAAGGRKQPGDGLEQGGLARAVGPHQGQQLPRLQGEADVRYHRLALVADAEPAGLHRGGHRAAPRGGSSCLSASRRKNTTEAERVMAAPAAMLKW